VSKKAEQKATKKNCAKRAAFRFRVKRVVSGRLIFLDEAGFQAGLHSIYGHSLRGKPAYFSMPATHHKNIIQVGAICLSGAIVMRGLKSAMTNPKF
jgi:hypothetical protein